MIPTADQFVGAINVPNLDSSGPSPEWEGLEAIGDQFQPLYLEHLLGDEAQTFLNGLSATEAKWEELRDGRTFTMDGHEYEFVGLSEILARYIYFEHIRSMNGLDSVIGVVEPEYENGRAAQVQGRAVTAWNWASRVVGAAEWYGPSLANYLEFGPHDYGDWSIDYDALRPINAWNV